MAQEIPRLRNDCDFFPFAKTVWQLTSLVGFCKQVMLILSVLQPCKLTIWVVFPTAPNRDQIAEKMISKFLSTALATSILNCNRATMQMV